MSNLSPILQTVKDILEPIKGKMAHVNEIADIAFRQNKTFGEPAEVFAKKISSSAGC